MAALPIPKLKLPPLGVLKKQAAAWWNGVDYVPDPPSDEESALEAAAAPTKAGVEAPRNALQDPRIIAAEAIWGPGRFGPGNLASDTLFAAALGLDKQSLLYIVGGEGGRRGIDIYGVCASYSRSFDWREGADQIVTKHAKAEKLASQVKPMPFSFGQPFGDAGKADAVLLVDTLQAVADPSPTLAHVRTALKSSGQVCCFELIARHADDTDLHACRDSLWTARHFHEEDTLIDAFQAAGFALETNEDVSAELLDQIVEGRLRVRDGGSELMDEVVKQGGLAALQAVLHDLFAWKARGEAMGEGRLTARRLLFSVR